MLVLPVVKLEFRIKKVAAGIAGSIFNRELIPSPKTEVLLDTDTEEIM